ncbi:MAG: tetratricopeptide (TPR) repeat protein [Kiritimatiellia bacterium]
MSLPGERLIELSPLPMVQAVQLFRSRATVDHTFDVGLIADIVERVDRVPLAIELAAARTISMDAQDLCDALLDPLSALDAPGASGRQGTLRRTIAWSWDLLSPQEQHALAQISLFQAKFRPSWAVRLVGTASVLHGLREKALLRWHPHAPGFLVLYAAVRTLALERLMSSGQLDRTRRRYHEIVFDVAGSPYDEPYGWSWANVKHLADLEHDLRAISRIDDAAVAVRAALLLDVQLAATGGESLRTQLSSNAVRHLDDIPDELAVELLTRLAVTSHGRGEREEAKRRLHAAVKRSRTSLDPEVAQSLSVAHAQLVLRTDPVVARRHLQAARSQAIDLGDPERVAMTWFLEGHLLEQLKDLVGAATAFAQAARISATTAVPVVEPVARYNLAFLALQQGDHDVADAEIQLGLRRLEARGDERAELARGFLVLLAQDRGDLLTAERLARACMAFGDAGHQRGVQGEDRFVHANVLHELGRLDEAHDRYSQAIEHYVAVGRGRDIAVTNGMMAIMEARRQRGGVARVHLREAEPGLVDGDPDALLVLEAARAAIDDQPIDALIEAKATSFIARLLLRCLGAL